MWSVDRAAAAGRERALSVVAAPNLPLPGGAEFSRTNYDLHRTLGFWSSVAMALFAITGINLHLQTGGGLFAMMDAKSTPVDLPGHGVTADALLQSAAEALPGARLMRISFWGGKRATLVQMRFPEDKTPAERSAVTLDPERAAACSRW